MNAFIWTIAVVTVLGLVLALVLYLVAQRFKVEEDPRIDAVEKAMPGANCGGCGFAGCRAFAEAAVKAPNLDNRLSLGTRSRPRPPWWLLSVVTAPVRRAPR